MELLTGGWTNQLGAPGVLSAPAPAPIPTHVLAAISAWAIDRGRPGQPDIPYDEIEILGRKLGPDGSFLTNLPVFRSFDATPKFAVNRTNVAFNVAAALAKPRVYSQAQASMVHKGFDHNSHPSRWYATNAYTSITTSTNKSIVEVWVDPPDAADQVELFADAESDELLVNGVSVLPLANGTNSLSLTSGAMPGNYTIGARMRADTNVVLPDGGHDSGPFPLNTIGLMVPGGFVVVKG